MLLEGVAIVPFASPFLDVFKEKKDFVFITLFIEEDGTATLFQQKNDEAVCCGLYRTTPAG